TATAVPGRAAWIGGVEQRVRPGAEIGFAARQTGKLLVRHLASQAAAQDTVRGLMAFLHRDLLVAAPAERSLLYVPTSSASETRNRDPLSASMRRPLYEPTPAPGRLAAWAALLALVFALGCGDRTEQPEAVVGGDGVRPVDPRWVTVYDPKLAWNGYT